MRVAKSYVTIKKDLKRKQHEGYFYPSFGVIMKIKIPAGTKITVDKPTKYGIASVNIVTKKELTVDVAWEGVSEYYFKFNDCTYAACVEKQKVEVI